MNFSDKKTQMIAGGVAVVAVVIILAVLLLGKKGGQQPADQKGGPPWAQGGQQGAGGWQGGGGQQTAANAGGAGAGLTPTPGQAAPGAAAGGPLGTKGTTPKPGRPWGALLVGSGENSMPSRPDPLLLLQAPPPKIPVEVKIPLPTTNIVEGGLRPGGDEAQVVANGTIANRRVAGVKFNGGAWAILDDGRDTFVVKPGDVVDGTKINSISRDAIYVTDPDGQKWIVPLRGAGPGGPGQPVSSR